MIEALPRIARVDLDALRSNYRSLEQLAAGRKVIAVVKRIVDLHAGRLAVESVEGQGTTIRVRLPRHTQEDGE